MSSFYDNYGQSGFDQQAYQLGRADAATNIVSQQQPFGFTTPLAYTALLTDPMVAASNLFGVTESESKDNDKEEDNDSSSSKDKKDANVVYSVKDDFAILKRPVTDTSGNKSNLYVLQYRTCGLEIPIMHSSEICGALGTILPKVGRRVLQVNPGSYTEDHIKFLIQSLNKMLLESTVNTAANSQTNMSNYLDSVVKMARLDDADSRRGSLSSSI